MSNTPSTPAGWYPDTNKPGSERWWDGTAWGDQSRPVSAPAVAAPATPATVHPQAGAMAPQAGEKKSKMGTGVLLGILAAGILLVGGCVAVAAVVFVGDDDNSETVLIDSSGETTDDAAGDAPEVDDAEGDATEDDATDTGDTGGDQTDAGETPGDPMESVVTCSRPDSDTAIVEMVNRTGELTSFLLTVGYFDESGQRLAEETGFISYLRPGETVVENMYLFEEVGTSCEILEVELIPALSQPEALADIGTCDIAAEANEYGGFDATVTATNSTSETLDYSISMAFVGPDGIRRSGATTRIESVRANETAPGEVFSPTDYTDGFTCEIVGAHRS